MIKGLFFLLTIVLSFNLISQDSITEIVLDNKIDLKYNSYYSAESSTRNHIFYQNFNSDSILRFEEDKLQMYDGELNKLWEVDVPLEKTTERGNDYRFKIFNNKIYILQRAQKNGHFKNCITRLSIVSEDGKKKVVELWDFVAISTILDMSVTENACYVMVSGYLKNEPKKSLYNQYILKFDLSGKYVSNINISDVFHESDGINWYYYYFQDGNFIFLKEYYKNKNGKLYHNKQSSGDEYYREVMRLNEDFKIVKDESIESNEEEESEIDNTFYLNISDDLNYTTVLKNNMALYLKDYLKFPEVNKIWLEINGQTTSTLLQDVLKFCANDISSLYVNKFKFVGAVADPLNNVVNIIVQFTLKGGPAHVNLVLVVDKELTLRKIIAFSDHTYNFWLSYYNSINIGFEFAKLIRCYGSINENHKMTAIEYAAEFGKRGLFYTVLHHGKKQLLFIDNRFTKTTTVKIFE